MNRNEKLKSIYDMHYNKKYLVEKPYLERLNIQYLVRKCSIKPGSRVLDIGCGTGSDMHFFSEEGMKTDGIDISEQAISLLRHKYPHLNARCADIHQIKLPDSYYDIIFCKGYSVFDMENEKEIISFIDSISQALKDNGIFIFMKSSTLQNKKASKTRCRIPFYDDFNKFLQKKKKSYVYADAGIMDYSLKKYQSFFNSAKSLSINQKYVNFMLPYAVIRSGNLSGIITFISRSMASAFSLRVNVIIISKK